MFIKVNTPSPTKYYFTAINLPPFRLNITPDMPFREQMKIAILVNRGSSLFFQHSTGYQYPPQG